MLTRNKAVGKHVTGHVGAKKFGPLGGVGGMVHEQRWRRREADRGRQGHVEGSSSSVQRAAQTMLGVGN